MPRNIFIYFLNMEIVLFVLKVLQCESFSDQIHTFIRKLDLVPFDFNLKIFLNFDL